MLLALDTSTPTLGLALYDEPEIIGELIWRTANHHTVELAPAIEHMLKRCGVTPIDLQAIAVALGPGSFTSLRIGLALAKGMALSLHLPLIGIPTFNYLADSQPLSDCPMIAVLPAGRTRMAVQWFRSDGNKWQPSTEPTVMTPQEISDSIIEPTNICGEMNAIERQVIGRKWKNAILAAPSHSIRRPSVLAELAWLRWKAGKIDDPVSLSPIYVHIAGSIQE